MGTFSQGPGPLVDEAGRESPAGPGAVRAPIGDRHDASAAFPWRSAIVWTVMLAGLAYLLTRHANHVVQYLPLLVLVACPLMHQMHHHRHGR